MFAAIALLTAPAVRAEEAIVLPDLEGQLHNPLAAGANTKAIVALFVSVECPVSNRYAPELQRIAARFAPDGVEFLLIYPNPAETPAAIREHVEAFGHPGRVLRDPEHLFVKASGVTITPEVAVFDAAGHLAYRGRIDDRYVRIGLERPAPTRRDLVEALGETVGGRPVTLARTDAVGCFIADFVHVH